MAECHWNSPKETKGDMNRFMQPTRRELLTLTFAALIAGGAIDRASADIVSLHDGNSDATVDLSSQAGMSSWLINGQNQLNQQWFWYRVGNDSTGQHSIDTIGGLSYSQNANSLSATYTSPTFSLTIFYTLSGGLAGGSDWTSDITESISIQNLTASTLDFHFYQYSDFALGGTPGGETASVFLNNDNFYTSAKVTKSGNQISETIDQPLANAAETDLGTATLSRLNSGSPYTLNGNTSAGDVNSTDDATWALQWNFQIAAGDNVFVLKDKRLSVAPVPEPASFSLVLLGAAAFALRRKRSNS